MKVLVITGSPHRQGTSATLADAFIQGAQEAGHEVTRFDAAFKNVHPCIACERCHTTDLGCTFQDDMSELNSLLLAADAVVFASPIHYFGMSASITAVVGRFYANNAALQTPKKSALLLACTDTETWVPEGAIHTFQNISRYLKWDVSGIVTAMGCPDREAVLKTVFPQQAYELGLHL